MTNLIQSVGLATFLQYQYHTKLSRCLCRKRLQEWREAKGISYKRPPMPVKPQVKRTAPVLKSFWPTMKDEDEAHSLICAVDRSLADCIQLLKEVFFFSVWVQV